MRAKLFLFFLLSHSIHTNAQDNLYGDSLVIEICNTIKKEPLNSDSATLANALLKNIKKPVNVQDSSFQQLVNYCIFRLQRQCPEFKVILDKVFPTKGDWAHISSAPKSSASKKDCDEFFTIKQFKYFESDGNATNVIITTTGWTDYFKDGTTSQLSLKRESDTTFVITFLKSDNESRKNFSKPGDQYKYTIIKRESSYYEMMVEAVGVDQKMTFKLYYQL